MEATNNSNHHQEYSGRTSKGRQKIEIKRVEKQSSRYVTFSKRKSGLFKKATELSALCGAETAVIVFSEHQKIFSCGQPDLDRVVNRFLAETERVSSDHTNSLSFNNNNHPRLLDQQKLEYAKSLRRLEEGQRVAKMMENNDNNANHGGFWWDLPVENMDAEELQAYKESMEGLRKNVVARIEWIEANNNAAAESRFANLLTNPEDGPLLDFGGTSLNGELH